jgi:hypothetical protein
MGSAPGPAYDGHTMMIGRCDRGRRQLCAGALGWAAALTGCGGGVYLGIGFGGPDDRPPQVALAASVVEGLPGTVVHLVAAATDDFGVDRVTFLRREASGTDTVLATDNGVPYQLDVTLPAAAPGTVLRYLARAVDTAGQSTDSTPLEVTVR